MKHLNWFDLPPSAQQVRRRFLKASGAAAVTGAAAPLAFNLATMGSVAAQTADDNYKALVCIFLFGGMDCNNTVIPTDPTAHAKYLAARPSLGFALNTLTPLTDRVAGRQPIGLPASLAGLAPLYEAGRLGVVANVGPLVMPTTAAQYRARTATLPAKLYSHNDQQSNWQSFAPEGAPYGWAGRMLDRLATLNGDPVFSAVSLGGNTVMLNGEIVEGYRMTTSGPVAVGGLTGSIFGTTRAGTALRSLMTESADGNLLAAEHAAMAKRSINAAETATSALNVTTTFAAALPANNGLANQLRMVARMIAGRSIVNQKRQVFFVSMGGFDTHSNQNTSLNGLHGQIAAAMAWFDAALTEMGMANKVTTFTASDFGRTLATNGDGSDHGWGAHHFVMGGAVQGRTTFGTFPDVGLSTTTDAGSGRLIPTTSVDQFAATLGKWFGLTDSQLLDILPNLRNFTQRDIGIFA